MANGMFDLTGWRIMTPEEVTKYEEQARQETEEFDRRWPPAQRRPRCLACGAFMSLKSNDYTRCKCCDNSFMDLQ